MPDIQTHKKQNNKNKLLAEKLKAISNTNDDVYNYSDWIVTILFYASLHYVDMYLHNRYNVKDEDIDSHQKRNLYIKNNCDTKLHCAYKNLYTLSQNARYNCSDVTKKIQFAENQYSRIINLCSPSASGLSQYKV